MAPPELVVAIPNGIDPEVIHQLAQCQTRASRAVQSLPRTIFVAVGRLVSAKATLDLLDAFATCIATAVGDERSGSPFIVGDGSLKFKLQKPVSDIGIGNRVHFWAITTILGPS